MNTGENVDAGLNFFRHSGICLQCYIFFLSTTSSMDVKMFSFPKSTATVCLDAWWCTVSLYITSSVWTWGCIPFHHQQCGRDVVSLSTVRHPISPVPDWIKMPMPEAVGTGLREPNPVPKCSGTGMSCLGARIPMPAALVSMPMPSHGTNALRKCLWYTLCNLHQTLAESFLFQNWEFEQKIIFISAVG
jgi:hypothetical protein